MEPAEKEAKTPTQDILQAENDKEKSGDKREIEDEEREKMLNEENKKELGEVEKKKKALEEAEREKEGTKRRIPTGGIKIPGFLRSRSRDKNKVNCVFIYLSYLCISRVLDFVYSHFSKTLGWYGV